jgi:hypothetical protein
MHYAYTMLDDLGVHILYMHIMDYSIYGPRTPAPEKSTTRPANISEYLYVYCHKKKSICIWASCLVQEIIISI